MGERCGGPPGKQTPTGPPVLAAHPGGHHIPAMPTRLLPRFLTGCAVVLGVITLSFILLHLAPGDPAAQLAGPAATPAQVEALRVELGLDRSAPVQFVSWLGRAVRGDWGVSLATGRPVAGMLGDAWPATALLVTLSLGLSYLLGVAIALLQATPSR